MGLCKTRVGEAVELLLAGTLQQKGSVMTAEFSSLHGKKVMITGGLGFIGSNLAHRCLELGAEVTIYDCLDPRSGGNLYNIEQIKDSVEILYHNILSFEQLSQHVVRKDFIFNCAASTSHPFSMREPWIDLDVLKSAIPWVQHPFHRRGTSPTSNAA